MTSDLPTIRLRPKADARAIRHGFPWVYSDEVVLDRRTKAIGPGRVARLEDAERRALGLVTVNPGSRIVARMLDRSPDAQIDTSWIASRLQRALALREALHPTPHYRLVHAEADGLPGVVIDRFGDAAAFQPNTAWADAEAEAIVDALREVTGVATVVRNGASRARRLEGLPDITETMVGTIDCPVAVPMNGATYMADLLGGQKTGLFYDQRPNHAFVSGLARGARVLDVFTHVGGFALAALANGAQQAVAVDSSQAALDLAEAGAAKTGVSERLSVRQGEAFDTLETLAKEGARFEVVVCDPPAFAPNRQSLEAGLRAYERVARLAAPLVTPGGFLTLCSCSHAADLTRFRNASARGIGRGGRRSVLIRTGFAGPDHPQLPHLAETGYLKALTFRLDG